MSSEVTLSYGYGVSAIPLLGETIGANLRRVAAAHPDGEALVDVPTSRRWTYAVFDAETDMLARGLIAVGLAAGDRVGIWAPNCAEWVQLQYATAKAGIILVNINPAYRSHELSYALRQSGVRILVSAERFKTSDYRAMIGEVRPDLAALEDAIFIGTPQWDALFEAGQAVAADGDLLAEREASLSFDDPINIQYTSGTTGFPKGATLSHHNILNNALFIGEDTPSSWNAWRWQRWAWATPPNACTWRPSTPASGRRSAPRSPACRACGTGSRSWRWSWNRRG